MHERLVVYPEGSFFADYKPEQFTPQEAKILEPFFSNLDKPVFVVSGLSPTLCTALIGRHSQSPGSMRRIFVEKYIKDKERLLRWTEKKVGNDPGEFLGLAEANSLLEKNFVRRGHDSLVATFPLILGFERVSQLGAKGIEDTRIGLSPIERSTRYGFFGNKVDGRYLYARPPTIMHSKHARLFERAVDNSLDLYVELQESVVEAYRKKYPEAGDWKIKQMTFDATRVLLVAGCFTNLGVLVNGQAAENMILKLKSSELQEHQQLGQMVEHEVAKVAPFLVGRVRNDYGQRAIEYFRERREKLAKLVSDHLSGVKPEVVSKEVALTAYDLEGENKVVAKILWPGCDLSERQVLEVVRQLSPEDKEKIIKDHIGQRPDRRIKVGRAFEEAVLSFQIVCRFAEWRDLQRNRILTPFWRRLDFSHGVDVGEDLEEFGFEQTVKSGLENLAEAHATIAKDFPEEAQYIVAFGALMPYFVTLNFRELVHIAELRTDPGAHKDYAKTASDMARLGSQIYPLLAGAFQFVNWR